MSTALEGPFAVIGGITAAAVLFLYVFVEFIKPIWRRRELRHPCYVWFNIISTSEGKIDYAAQDDRVHHVKELVLPTHSEVPIEIIYLPRIAYFEVEFAFGCETDVKGKPYAFECFSRFVTAGKSHWTPDKDEGHYVNRHQFYWIVRNRHRSPGTHRVVGFRVRTEIAGVFPAKVYFMTDEIEGSADLTIRVEDYPRTLMRCSSHGGCLVNPA